MKKKIWLVIVALIFSLNTSFADWDVAPPRPPFYKRWYNIISRILYYQRWSPYLQEERELSKGMYVVDTFMIEDPVVIEKEDTHYVFSKKQIEKHKSKFNNRFFESPNVYIMLNGYHYESFLFCDPKMINLFDEYLYLSENYPDKRYDFPSLGLYGVKLELFYKNSLIAIESNKKKLEFYQFEHKRVVFLMALVNTRYFDTTLRTSGGHDPSPIRSEYPNNRYIKVVFPVYIAADSDHITIKLDSLKTKKE